MLSTYAQDRWVATAWDAIPPAQHLTRAENMAKRDRVITREEAEAEVEGLLHPVGEAEAEAEGLLHPVGE